MELSTEVPASLSYGLTVQGEDKGVLFLCEGFCHYLYKFYDLCELVCFTEVHWNYEASFIRRRNTYLSPWRLL